MRSRASRAMRSAIFSSTMPAPAATVSAAWASAVSPSATAAAIPPCAHRLDAPSPNRAAETTVTGSGASLSAVNSPASPAPTITTPPGALAGNATRAVMGIFAWASMVEVDHALDRGAGTLGDGGIDRDLLLEEDEAFEDLRQRDPLHMRAEIAWPHEGDVRRLDGDVVAHRALGHEQHFRRLVVLDPLDHARGRAGEIGFRQHVGRTFGVGDDLHAGIGLAIGAELLAGEEFMHLAMTLPGDDLNGGLGRDPLGEILVGNKDHALSAERLDHAHGVGRGAADIGLGLYLGRGVDIGDDRHAGIGF